MIWLGRDASALSSGPTWHDHSEVVEQIRSKVGEEESETDEDQRTSTQTVGKEQGQEAAKKKGKTRKGTPK